MRNPVDVSNAIQAKFKQAIEESFSDVSGRRQSLKVSNIVFEEMPEHDDYARQKDIIASNKTEGCNVYMDLTLVDNKTGKILEEQKRVKTVVLPTMTNRFSFIISGQEYIVPYQFRLDPGIYTKLDQNNLPTADFNLARGRNMKVFYMPAKERMMMNVKNTNLPLYTVLKDVFKTPDIQLIKTFGKEFHYNEMTKHLKDSERGITSLYKSLVKDEAPETKTKDEKIEAIKAKLDFTVMDPIINKMTMGQPFTKVNSESLLHAAGKVLDLHKNLINPTYKDNIAFKSVYGAEDFVHETLTKNARMAKAKLGFRIDNAKKISQIGFGREIGNTLNKFFIDSDFVNYPVQVNPLEFIENSHKITSMGPGGIGDVNALALSQRDIDLSHQGFLDPVRTPDNMRAGVDLRTTIQTFKEGNTLKMPVLNKWGKEIIVTPRDLFNKTYAFENEKQSAPGLFLAVRENKLIECKKSEIDYFLRPDYMLTATTASIPYVENNQGQRCAMGAKMHTQALSLINREAPLVSTEAHKLIETAYIPKAPVDGTIHEIAPDSISVKDHFGKIHKVNTPNNFALNYHSYLHFDANSNLKVGDKVKRRQVLGDTNFSKDGKMAYGVNMDVAYIPYGGLNFDDGIVLTQQGADKLSSSHILQMELPLNGNIEVGEAKFKAGFSAKYNISQLGKMENGIIRKGQKVTHNDPLILAVMKTVLTPESSKGGAVFNRMANPYKDMSVIWDRDYPGEVIDVIQNKEFVKVIIKATSPMEEASKLCYDEDTEALTKNGWKNIADININDEVCTLRDGEYIEYNKPDQIHHYPVGGRMYRIKNQSIDLFVTDEHSMYVKKRYSNSFNLIPAKDIYKKTVKYKKDGIWIGDDKEFITIPGMEVVAGQSGNGFRKVPEFNLKTSTVMMLAGMFLSEGNIVNDVKSGSYGIDICQIKEPNKQKMLDALDGANIKYNEHNHKTKIRIYSKQLMEFFMQFGSGAKNKNIPSWVFDLDKKYLEILFNWIMWGDGTVGKNKDTYNCYTTISKKLADDIQVLCLYIGKAGNVQKKHDGRYEIIKGKEYWCQPRYDVRIINAQKKMNPIVNTSNRSNYQEEYFEENYNKPVHCVTVKNHVLYVRRNGKGIWSGNCGRYGNKGIVSAIIPNHLAPKKADGSIPDVLMNPSSIPSRMNMGQVYETALGKIIKQTGAAPVHFQNFSGRNAYDDIVKQMKKAGVSDTDTYINPVNGKKITGVFNGQQYIMKLFKEAETGFSARAGGSYDCDGRPLKGGEEGSKSIGNLDFYAHLAHRGGSKGLLREAATYKAEYNPQFWAAILQGKPLPVPAPTFTFKKFIGMMQGAGINVQKQGNEMKLLPFTDKDILKISNGEIKLPKIVSMKPDPVTGLPFRPEAGGLFDHGITGGLKGDKFGHINLAVPIVNALFEKPIRSLLDLKTTEFDKIAEGSQHVEIDGIQHTGGEAIQKMLKKINVKKDLNTVYEDLQKTKSVTKKDALRKKARYLKSLYDNNLEPHEAYVLNKLPVIPPIFRPIYPDANNKLVVADSNKLYENVLNFNHAINSPIMKSIDKTNPIYKDVYKGFYDSVRKLQGLDGVIESMDFSNREPKGFIKTIVGANAKYGYFQNKLLSRVQDITGRAVVAPDPSLSIDECGIPKKMAWQLYKPFIIGSLSQQGYSLDESTKHIETESQLATNALLAEMETRPVILNRAPSLHKYNVQAFKPKLVEGKHILTCPLVNKTFNLDHDGDQMTVHIPVSPAGIKDAWNMLPSNNLFSPLNRNPVFMPDQEAVFGLYTASKAVNKMGEVRRFKTNADAIRAYNAGLINVNDEIEVAA